MSERYRNFHERRDRVRQIVDSPAGLDIDPDKEDDLLELKLAEYALLIKPVTAGVRNYLSTYTPPEERLGLDINTLNIQIGAGVGHEVICQLRRSPESPIIRRLAERRGQLGGEMLAENITPLGKAVANAAESSAVHMSLAVFANASALYSNGKYKEMSRAEFIRSLKKSVNLPTQWVMSELAENALIGAEVYELTEANLNHPFDVKEPGLRYDDQERAVKLARPLLKWETTRLEFLGTGGQDNVIGAGITESERIGCPMSFDPKLVGDYYSHIVDLIEFHQAWPAQLLDKRIHLPPTAEERAPGMFRSLEPLDEL